MSKPRKKINNLQAFVLAAGLWYIFLWFFAIGFVQYVSHKNHVKVEGKVFPTHILPGRFRIADPKIEWQKNLTLKSGTIDVHIREWSFLTQSILISVTGKNLEAQMDKSYPIREASLTIKFIKSEDPIIYSLNVDSPQLQINMSEKKF